MNSMQSIFEGCGTEDRYISEDKGEIRQVDMEKLLRKIAVMLLVLTFVISVPGGMTALAEEPGGEAVQTEQPSGNEGTTPSGSEETTPSEQPSQNEQTAPTEQKTQPAADAQKTEEELEKELIAKYGYYNGTDAKKIPVLAYHQVVSDRQKRGSYSRNSLAVSKSTFNRQMKYLYKKGYRTICCDELYLWHQGKIKLPKKSVLVTFDDGNNNVLKYGLPVLKKYNMKATMFLHGQHCMDKDKGYITLAMMKKSLADYPNFEYQSHTYHLHHHYSDKSSYRKMTKDVKKMNKLFGFRYIAYPYGRYTKGIIRALKENGVKMGISYGHNGYATKKQNIYKIKRIKVDAKAPFSKFTRWFK